MVATKKYLLLLPVIIMIVSGCTSGPGVGTGPGVVILGWEPELTNIYSNDDIDFLLKIQNQGESDARNVRADLTNIDPVEWGGFGFQEKQLGNLIKADQESGTPGETKTTQFLNLRAPMLAEGTAFTFEPIVRVSFDYTSTAIKPITIVDTQELVRIQQSGQALPAKPTLQTEGPLDIQIIMKNFVRTSSTFSGFGQEYDIFPVQIIVTNKLWESGGSVTHDGFLGSFGGFGEYDYPVQVSIEPPSGTNFVYSGFGDDCSSFQFTIDLFRGKQAEVTCELEVTSPPTIRQESNMKVELEYRFFSDRSTQIHVQGIQEVGTGFF